MRLHYAIKITIAAIFVVTVSTTASARDNNIENIDANRIDFAWSSGIAEKVSKAIQDKEQRQEFLKVVSSEAKRANLDPYLVISVIEHSSNFRKHKVASTGERGYMLVPPYWVKLIGREDTNLFHTLTNIRFGCTIIRSFIDEHGGDLDKALTKYGGKNLSALVLKDYKK